MEIKNIHTNVRTFLVCRQKHGDDAKIWGRMRHVFMFKWVAIVRKNGSEKV